MSLFFFSRDDTLDDLEKTEYALISDVDGRVIVSNRKNLTLAENDARDMRKLWQVTMTPKAADVSVGMDHEQNAIFFTHFPQIANSEIHLHLILLFRKYCRREARSFCKSGAYALKPNSSTRRYLGLQFKNKVGKETPTVSPLSSLFF